MQSLFEKELEGFSQYPALEKDLEVEVAVVGGGMAGMLTAFQLARDGRRVALFEAGRVGGGTTARTTAAVTALQGLFYFGRNPREGGLYLSSQLDATALIRKIIEEYSIDCDYEEVPAYLFAAGKRQMRRLSREYNMMRLLGARVDYVNNPHLSGPAIKMDRQGQFNPLKFLAGLPKNFDIYENTRIKDFILKDKTLKTEGGHTIIAHKIVIATRFPPILEGQYYLKMYQTKSCVIAFRHKKLEGAFNGAGEGNIYFRSYGDRVLLGGFDHRTGHHKRGLDYYQKLKEAASSIFFADSEDFIAEWSAEDAVTFDDIPFAGRITRKKKHSDIYMLGGFNEWGMTNAAICSKTVSDMIAGRETKYEELFCPTRPYYIKNMVKLLRHGAVAAAGLARGLFKGKKACRHIHCAMRYNRLEGAWECPCHGSRYDKEGRLLDGPATKNLGE